MIRNDSEVRGPEVHHQLGGAMDTQALVVGQEVHMESGCYGMQGKVVRVTPSGVDVQTGVMQSDGTWNAHEILHFDRDGKGRDEEGTLECGPWYICGSVAAAHEKEETRKLYQNSARRPAACDRAKRC